MRSRQHWMSILAYMIGALAAVPVTSTKAAEQDVPYNPPVYVHADTLQESLLATRARYRTWLEEQPDARRAVTFGPWSATKPLATTEADKLVQPDAGIDLKKQVPGGGPLWSPRKDLIDGKVVRFGGGSGETAVYLTRTVTAKKKTQLTVGAGGGDRLDMWLGGKKIASAPTHLVSGRYGCSYKVDGTRVDQVLADLDLEAGNNVLVIRLTPSDQPTFYFSPSPRPVPRLWEQVRRDFPASYNPLLDLVHDDWFAPDGWFADSDAKREQAFVAGILGDCGADGPAIRVEMGRLRRQKIGPDDRRWLDLCVKASVSAALRTDLARLRAAVTELARLDDAYPTADLLAKLDDYGRRLGVQANGQLDPTDEATRRLMDEMPKMQREMLVDLNPLLKDTELLFVKRHTYNSKHYYDDILHISRFGGNLCVLSLSHSLSDGRVRELAPQLAEGIFDRYDLSFDAQRVVFGYRRPRREGFRIYEIGIDGTGLRPITRPPADEDERIAKYGQTSAGDNWYGSLAYRFWTDDLHPCYLPDGGICFASTRCEHGVLCTPAHYLACTNLYRVDGDGGSLKRLSYGALSEFTPTLMEDGRILYNRWEYVYKGIGGVQPLWTMRPDGSGTEEFYGDNVTNPGVLWQARQIPGNPRGAVCIGCGHEPLGIGQVLLLDLNKSKRTLDPITSLTPHTKTKGLRGLYQMRNGRLREDIYGPFYSDPYPLSNKFFLVSCNPAGRYNDESAYGIYLLDAFGNRVLIYDDPETSCWQPMPLRPRKRPPVFSPVDALAAKSSESSKQEPTGTVFLSDVYRGLPGVKKGTVKYIRVMQQIGKPWAAEIDPLRQEDRNADGFGGHIAVSMNAHIWIAVLRGIVPVEEDGSACFKVPANQNLFFQALDEDFMEVQRMRTFITLMPGERRSCIGCHEPRTQAPVSRMTAAYNRPAAALSAQPGGTAPRPLHYPTDVQPILDRHCVSCHNGKDPKAAPDLRGDMTQMFCRSYEAIFKGGLVDTIQEWNGADHAMANVETVPPYSHGSHRSKLVELLKKGHYDVDLSREEWIKLVTWIDCGAPYYGSYYGRRNLTYRGAPDFRPVPTLASACGIQPDFPAPQKPEPIPAELLAWWTFDEEDGSTVTDHSGRGNRAELVAGKRTADGRTGRGIVLDGTGYVESTGLGHHEAVSVAMWVRPRRLIYRWSPLLFTSHAVTRVGIPHEPADRRQTERGNQPRRVQLDASPRQAAGTPQQMAPRSRRLRRPPRRRNPLLPRRPTRLHLPTRRRRPPRPRRLPPRRVEELAGHA